MRIFQGHTEVTPGIYANYGPTQVWGWVEGNHVWTVELDQALDATEVDTGEPPPAYGRDEIIEYDLPNADNSYGRTLLISMRTGYFARHPRLTARPAASRLRFEALARGV